MPSRRKEGNRARIALDRLTGAQRRTLNLSAWASVAGSLILIAELGCVALAIDVLHVTNPVVQTSARLVGIVLGTLFRFWTYRQFVFVRELADLPPVPHSPEHESNESAESNGRAPAAGPANGAGAEK